MSGYVQDSLDIEVEPLSAKEQKVIGYSTGKWSDDDDWKGPFIPFLGAIK